MDDSGEMVAASWNLGLPHPPGYPFFDLLGHVFSWIPVGSVAFRFNLMSSVIFFISISVVLKTCLELANKIKLNKSLSMPSVERLLVFVTLIFFFSENIFSQCLSAKGCVYALTLLLISVLIWLRVLGSVGEKWIYLVWFLWGLGLANHWQTVILLVPFMILLTVSKLKIDLKDLIFIGFTSILGLSLYLYLPLRTRLSSQPSWGFPLHWSEFKWIVFRQLVADEEMKVHFFSFYAQGLLAIFKSYRLFLPGVAVLAVMGLWVIYHHEKKMARDFFALFLPIVLALTLVHEEYNLYLMPVYLVPLSGLVVLLGFVGLLWLLAGKGNVFQATLIFVLILFAAFWGWGIFETQNKTKYMLAEDFAVNVMKLLPRGSVFLADGDNYVMPLWYAKYVTGKRPDLIMEPMVFLYHDWGWNQIARQSNDLKEVVQSTAVYEDRLTRLVEDERHPFFYSFGRQFWPETLNRLKGHWVVNGLSYGWTPLALTDEKMRGDLKKALFQERLRGLVENLGVAMEDPSTNGLYHCYGEERLAAANWFRDHKDDLGALTQLDSALSVLPKSALVYANMASLVGQRGFLEMSRYLCFMAIAEDPKMGLSYVNLAKVDSSQGRYLEAKQEYEKATSLGINRGWVEGQMSLLDHQAQGTKMFKDKSRVEYRKWSEILEKSGCLFLSQLAFQYSEKNEKPLN
jgi:tetratricopeptide (TPR) repeat protein